MHVQTLPLRKVDEVKFDRACAVLVLDLEVEPLMVPTRVAIDAHVHVKLTGSDLHRHV